ncbi:MAG TPA: alpha/beta hydrolase-fold protein [Pirellulales bacterium]|nr:alpha/beta hydrolase-fold protein [Pirellulales bacterium]
MPRNYHLRTVPMFRFLSLIMALAVVTTRQRLVADEAVPITVNVTLGAATAEQPLSGRLFVYCSRKTSGEPRLGPDWFSPEPFFAVEVNNFKPGLTRVVDDRADAFPEPLSSLAKGKYRVQALLDQDLDSHHPAYGAGNVYSSVKEWRLDESPSVDLVLDHVVAPRKFQETAWLKEVSVESKLLSEFHERPIRHQAAVVLPASYERELGRRYPVLYIIPGFGGTHYDAARMYPTGAPTAEEGEAEFIRVLLSGDCKWGHHVFADSETNGPRGAALVRELVPYIDATYRTVAAPTARFISGHSSGGWSSLWVQVNYAETFGGVWSTAPDPVDFHDWQQVDLYANPPLSLYYDEQGDRRPIARLQGKPVLWYASFGRMDDVLGRGGQLRSFEAVFSPLDENGLPQKLWDRETGKVDADVVQAWSKYDISRMLKRDWLSLEPKLRGKLHVYVGSLDTFYLDGAVHRLADTVKELGSDAEVVVVPGKNHSDLLSQDLRHKIIRQMSQRFLAVHGGPAEGRTEQKRSGAAARRRVGQKPRRMPATAR